MKIFAITRIRLSVLTNMMLFVIAACLGLGLWFTTPHGLGLTPDSVAYLKAAQGLSKDLGFKYFSMQWPPGYSSLIYLIGTITGDDFIRSARLINGVAYSLLFYILSRLLEKCCQIDRMGAAVIALLICLHPVVTHIFFYVLSEPSFLLIILVNITLLINYVGIDRPLPLRIKLLLILLGCLAVAFRYAGLTVVALNIWFVFFHSTTRVMKLSKWIDVLLQTLPALLLVSIWRLHRGIGDTEANERPLVLHMVTSEDIRYGLVKIGSWFVSPRVNHYDDPYGFISYSIGLMIFGLLLGLFLWSNAHLLIQRTKIKYLSIQKVEIKNIWILSTFILGYIAFLLMIKSLFDPNIIFDNRTISPLFLFVFITLITTCYLLKAIKYRYAAITILFIILIFQSLNFKSWILLSYHNGIELNDKNFKARSINLFIKNCDRNINIAADKPWSFNLYFSTMVYWLPQYYLYGSGLPNTKYLQQVNELVNIQDLLVVEDVKSEIVKNIDALHTFKRIYSADDGIVWQNTRIKSNVCIH
jgi:hypothetical protein